VGPGVRVEPVVKADAYGHGAVPISLALQAAGADGCCVATLDEALELRAAGVTIPVLVLYPVPGDGVAVAARAGIAVTLGPGATGERILRAAADLPRPLEIHLEVETGLGRGGTLPEDAAAMVRAVQSAPGVRLVGIWTHLASAGEPASAADQDRRFAAALDAVDGVAFGASSGSVRRHLAGSGGIVAADVKRWDAVRPGIAIYGIVPDGLAPAPAAAPAAGRLRPVMALKARAVRVLDLPAGHGVSYGATFVTSRPSRIATLPLGYGDGWRRGLSDRAEVLVRGVRAPLVGLVAMDAVMADVTDVPGPAVTEDDEFVLLGEQGTDRITATQLAAACGTISYEIVTGMSRRLARVYHSAASVIEMRTLADGRSEWPA
jgi:alanine racemase